MKKYVLCLLICSAFLVGCKDEIANPYGVEGEWSWIRSIGGDNGEIITPFSTGNTMRLEIDSETYKHFWNDSLVLESGYIVETRTDSSFGSDKVLVLDSGSDFSLIQTGDTLTLSDIRLHGYVLTYTRN